MKPILFALLLCACTPIPVEKHSSYRIVLYSGNTVVGEYIVSDYRIAGQTVGVWLTHDGKKIYHGGSFTIYEL